MRPFQIFDHSHGWRYIEHAYRAATADPASKKTRYVMRTGLCYTTAQTRAGA
jgi:hypothetical protein